MNCKRSILVFFIAAAQIAVAQKLPVLQPVPGGSYRYTPNEQVAWQKAIDLYFNNSGEGPDYDTLPETEKLLIDSLEMGYGPLTQGPGCSWYCGGGPYEVTASSFLPDSKNNTYAAAQAHDFSLLTAWVPDTKSGVIGAQLHFHFKPFSPRVNEITVYNGYLKNEQLWQQNARVKKLKLYVNNMPVALLALEDKPIAQSFRIAPVQSVDSASDLLLTLEVLETYPGTRSGDLAISEVNFSGLDVHCFAAGTQVLLADGTAKNIEHIKTGDQVTSFDPFTGKFKPATVRKLVAASHRQLYLLKFSDTSITTTGDHPFFVKDKGWCSLQPGRSNANYFQQTPVKQLLENDPVLFYHTQPSTTTLLGYTPTNAEQLTYTLELEGAGSFIVNGLVVKTEILLDSE